MAAPSNRSPSPLSSRPTNPNSRYSESNPSIRRSFSGNNNSVAKPSLLTNPRRLDPTTPANSPSDFARRRSVGIEGTASHHRDCEEKENEVREAVTKASKLQSPAKGSKNFMAPTISAASKFTPSPRKKVLVERNDPVRTSISLSDGKAMFFSGMPDASQDSDPNLAGSEDKNGVHAASRPSKKVTFQEIPSYSQHSTESVITDSDASKLEACSIAPLDADPSLLPYDPKTNYLSPRPQFIRYKPNPRLGMLLSKEKWLDPDDSLMEEIMSQNFSDSDEGTEESCREEMEPAAASASSPDMVIGMDEEIESESHVPEPLPVSTTPADEVVVQNSESKPRRSLFRWMCFSMIMMLLISAACVSISPSFNEMVVKDLSFSDLSNAYQQSRVAVAAKLNLVSSSYLSLVFKVANELGRGEKQRAPLKFMNLSDLQEDPWNEGRLPNIVVGSLEPVESLGEDALEEEVDVDTAEMDYAFEEETYAEDDEAFEEEEAAAAYASAEVDEISPDSVQLAELEPEYLQQDFPTETELTLVDAAASQHQETEPKADDQQAATISSDLISMPESIEASDRQAATIIPESTMVAEESFLTRNAVGILSLLAGGLLAVAAAAFIKRSHRPSSSNSVVKPVMRKQTDHDIKEQEFSQNWETENDAMNGGGGESYCPSEMSGSFQKSASYMYSSMSMREANEVESSERKKAAGRKHTKRESLASSTGSPSYGSFTTYERIPIKSNVSGDDEIVTPVRRSSRIRKHHVTMA